jgi:hypothetical protein
MTWFPNRSTLRDKNEAAGVADEGIGLGDEVRPVRSILWPQES